MTQYRLEEINENVKKSFFDEFKKLKKYEKNILLTQGKKTCLNMGYENNVTNYSLLKNLRDKREELLNIEEIIKLAIKNKEETRIIIDDTIAQKKYSKEIEGVWLLKDCNNKTFTTGYSIVVLAISIKGTVFILDIETWLPKEYSQQQYKTKPEIVQSLILKHLSYIKEFKFLFDGLYVNENFLNFLNNNNIKYTARMHKNRVVFYKNSYYKLNSCIHLKKIKNSHSRTIKCIWHSCKVFITAQYFKNKNNENEAKFIISNFKSSQPKDICNEYYKRWAIEVAFRELKQSLGFNDCRSRFFSLQINHIRSVCSVFNFISLFSFNNYTFDRHLFIKHLKYKKITPIDFSISRIDQIFNQF